MIEAQDLTKIYDGKAAVATVGFDRSGFVVVNGTQVRDFSLSTPPERTRPPLGWPRLPLRPLLVHERGFGDHVVAGR